MLFRSRRTADFLEKATWTLAIVLLTLSLISTAYKGNTKIETESEITEDIENMPAPVSNMPAMPTDIPTPQNK